MEHDLIERYVYAVTRRMDRKNREDVASELRGLIDDMLSERCGDLPPTEKDIRVVLTELGTPQELFEKYDEDSKKCLIGQPYYSTYILVLKIVVGCAALGMTISCLIEQLLEPQSWYALVGIWLGMVWSGVLQGFAIVTLLFAFFYHKGVKLGEPFNFDDLPPVPKKLDEIRRSDCLVAIGFCVVFMILFLAAADHLCVFLLEDRTVPMFTHEGTAGRWYLIVPFAILGIIREIVKLLERQFSRSVLVTTVVVDVLSAGIAVAWLGGNSLMNPEFTVNVKQLFAGDSDFIIKLFENFQYFFLGVILFALILDLIETIVRSGCLTKTAH